MKFQDLKVGDVFYYMGARYTKRTTRTAVHAAAGVPHYFHALDEVRKAAMDRIEPDLFTRIPSDINGNPRYILSLSHLMTWQEVQTYEDSRKNKAIARAKQAGGSVYRANNRYAVFQSFNLRETSEQLNAIMDEVKK